MSISCRSIPQTPPIPFSFATLVCKRAAHYANIFATAVCSCVAYVAIDKTLRTLSLCTYAYGGSRPPPSPGTSAVVVLIEVNPLGCMLTCVEQSSFNVD